MSMTLGQMQRNRSVWRSREIFRYNRWYYYRTHRDQPKKKQNIKYRKKWWKLYIEAREKVSWYDHEIKKLEPKPVGEGLTTYDGHPVANWIVPALQYARQHGWGGYVVSGYRSASEQWAAAENYCRELGVSLYTEYPNGPLASNHCGDVYPRGAVDVTEASELNNALRGYNGTKKLIWAEYTIEDGVHFSSNGH